MEAVVVRAQRHFCWCAQPLGLRCLRHLYELCSYWQSLSSFGVTGPKIVGVAIDSQDPLAPAIERLALDHGSAIYIDDDVPPANLDLGWSIGMSTKVPETTARQFVWGAVELHPGPLPDYAGLHPLAWAIINNERHFGVSLQYLGLDEGKNHLLDVWYRPLPPDATTLSQTPVFEQLAFELFCNYASRLFYEEVPAKSVPPNPEKVSFSAEPKVYSEADWQAAFAVSLKWPVAKLDRYVRGLTTCHPKLPYVDLDQRRLYLSLGAACGQ